MEQKSKLILSLLIAAVIVVAVLSSFGLNLLLGRTPVVTLPKATDMSGMGVPMPSETISENFVQVSVTPDTVQDIIRTLSRPESYERTVKIQRFSAGESLGEGEAQVVVDGGWILGKYTQATQPSGAEHTLVGGGTVYRWYGTARVWESWPADDYSADGVQHMLRYEDVLEVDKKDIVETDYVELEGIPCIYVAVEQPDLGYREHYWVSVVSGLLVCHMTEKNGQTVLSTSSLTYSIRSTDSVVSVTLPDGTTPAGWGDGVETVGEAEPKR